MPLTAQDWLAGREQARKEAVRQALRSGPKYDTRGTFTPWHDQFFGRELTPSGIIYPPQALRVGAVCQQLQVSVVASHANPGPLILAAGTTLTLSLLQGDSEQGSFEEVGPTICVKVPAGGKSVPPDKVVYAFALGDFTKPWLMVSLDFDGAVAGGLVDVALTFQPR